MIVETLIKIGDFYFSLGDLATWFTGIITFFLFVFTLAQIRQERNARKNDLRIQHDREVRAQAESISCWIERIESKDVDSSWNYWVAIQNLSSQPIYQVIVNLVPLTQRGEMDPALTDAYKCIAVVPPGKGYTSINFIDASRRLGVQIAFNDVIGTTWVRLADGKLNELNMTTAEYCHVVLPTYWYNLYPELPIDLRI